VQAPPISPPRDAPFVDIMAAAGIHFQHVTGGSPPLNILETAGAGGAMFDADSDGFLDLFLVNGRYRDSRAEDQQPRHVLYRNNVDGTFTDVTARAGVGGHGYGMGCAVVDVEGDGHLDLYVTHYGANVLYRNNGGRPMLLLNEVGTRRHGLSLRLVGRAPNRDAVGARVRLRAGGAVQMREVRAG
jgi:hypothetical protein